MTVGDLYNMFLRLVMASKENESEFRFDTGEEGAEPLGITAVDLDEDGDVCLECDSRCPVCMSAIELAGELRKYDDSKTVFFVYIDPDGSRELYNIKDGGFRDRHDPELRLVPAAELIQALSCSDPEKTLHFESGTINFTINSVYHDGEGCFCLESNEIMELDNYPVGMIIEELEALEPSTPVFFYDDEAGEYYGIYTDEIRISEDGDTWIKAR